VWGGAQVTAGDDEQGLIARATEGDLAAYEVLLERSVRAATRLAFAMLQDRSDAEDAFQEAALRAWRRIGNVRAGGRFHPWFVGIVANQCREMRRGRWWRTIRLPDVPVGPQADPVADWLEGEDLRRAVASLPHDQRAAIVLHFHLDMALSDVALALGLTSGGVKSRINRALKRLRPAMGAPKVNADV
jgi:RNA polymerase sigma-70 factor, ECF subfamily